MSDLQKAIANTPSQAPPVAPRYQGGPGQQGTQGEFTPAEHNMYFSSGLLCVSFDSVL